MQKMNIFEHFFLMFLFDASVLDRRGRCGFPRTRDDQCRWRVDQVQSFWGAHPRDNDVGSVGGFYSKDGVSAVQITCCEHPKDNNVGSFGGFYSKDGVGQGGKLWVSQDRRPVLAW